MRTVGFAVGSSLCAALFSVEACAARVVSRPWGWYDFMNDVQAMGGSLAEVEWEGILHWKTWALASLDCCISTTKCAGPVVHTYVAEAAWSNQSSPRIVQQHPIGVVVDLGCACCCRYALLVGLLSLRSPVSANRVGQPPSETDDSSAR
jgi:hypothetical protein